MNQQLLNRTEFFTHEDVNKQDNGHYEGKIVVLTQYKMNGFSNQYRNPQNQLFIAKGGFGCSPTAIGTAVYGTFLSDGEDCRLNRADIMGVLKKEVAHELGYCTCGKTLYECTDLHAGSIL